MTGYPIPSQLIFVVMDSGLGAKRRPGMTAVVVASHRPAMTAVVAR
jgi:hypothetical protein